jgi:hypothetical protein
MTTPDMAGLCERLRKPRRAGRLSQMLINPDGPEAANTLERQAAEIERLRGALTMAKGPLGSTGPTPVYEAVLAALTGEDT